jgi:hypothetical protein
MSEDINLYVREGVVGSPQEANKNKSVAEDTNKDESLKDKAKLVVKVLALKQVMSSATSNIGFATGNYELQEIVETAQSAIGVGIAGFIAPGVTAIGMGVKVGFEVWALGVSQNRSIYQQQQNQILTGKISVNGGRW